MGARNRAERKREDDKAAGRGGIFLSYWHCDIGKFNSGETYQAPEDQRGELLEAIKQYHQLQTAIVILERDLSSKLLQTQKSLEDILTLISHKGGVNIGDRLYKLECSSKSGIYIKNTNAVNIVCRQVDYAV